MKIYSKIGEKLQLRKAMVFCGLLCLGSYLLISLSSLPVLGLVGCGICGFSVGLLWPGTFSLAAVKLPAAGTAMYAFMALAGDVGCSAGPTVVGMAANVMDGDLKKGLLAGLMFPIMILVGMAVLGEKKAKKK